jgi:hypothetical protein
VSAAKHETISSFKEKSSAKPPSRTHNKTYFMEFWLCDFLLVLNWDYEYSDKIISPDIDHGS